MKTSETRPPGNRILGKKIRETQMAILFEYYSHEVWIPKSTITMVDGEYTAPLWTVETSKKYEPKNHTT